MNLGVHFVDLALALTGAQCKRIHCEISNRLHGEKVEDYASLTMRMDNGAVATIESGYAYPTAAGKRDFRLTIAYTGGYADFDGQRLRLVSNDGDDRSLGVSQDTDDYYRTYALDVIAAVRHSAAPHAGLARNGGDHARSGRGIRHCALGFLTGVSTIGLSGPGYPVLQS